MTTLNISNCTQITAADLKNVADIRSNLHTLYALEVPQIPLETILFLLKSPSNKIGQAYHTELFQKAFQVFPKTRKDLVEAPQFENIEMANPIDKLIIVKLYYEDKDIPESRDTGKPYWKAIDFQELNERDNVGNHGVVCPLGDIPLQATSVLW